MVDNTSNRVKLVTHLGKQVYVVQCIETNKGKRFVVLRGTLHSVDIRRSHNITVGGDNPSKYVYSNCDTIGVYCCSHTWIECSIDDVFFTAEGAGKSAANLNENELLKS